MKVAYISDMHLDFYVQPWAAWQRNLVNFLESLLPIEAADVLIVAGDLSHYNTQSALALQFFSERFQQVFYVMGNHDYYLVSNNQATYYNKNSVQREMELQEMTKSLPNVKWLHHYEAAEFGGVLFAGSTNWYGLKLAEEQAFFEERSNDSKLIRRFNIKERHEVEMAAYEQLKKVDVIVTHVPPFYVSSHLEKRSTACYLNPLPAVKAKHYVFGHCHEQEVYQQQEAMYYMNALGYPDEKLPRKIRVFTV